MPPAARISDMHTCPMVNPGPVPHVGGPVSSGSPDVLIGYIPAARVGDSAVCVPAVDSISTTSSSRFSVRRLRSSKTAQPVQADIIVAASTAETKHLVITKLLIRYG